MENLPHTSADAGDLAATPKAKRPSAHTRPAFQRTKSDVTRSAANEKRGVTSQRSESQQGIQKTTETTLEQLLRQAPSLQELKKAVDAKLANEQRLATRKEVLSPTSPHSGLAARRIPPTKESGSGIVSPSLDAAFASPSNAGMRTVSTDSTESAGTIRGSMPPTPSQNPPIRTPSYPFPYVPTHNPRPFHQPFTALSPTTASENAGHLGGRSETFMSVSTSPGSTTTFRPAGIEQHSFPDTLDYPSPNLYDVVLQMNSETGLDGWWTTLTSILRRWYSVDRASLTMPADPSDIENVPWGQKAAFDLVGLKRKRGALAAQDRKVWSTESWVESSQSAVPGGPSLSTVDRPTAARPNLGPRGRSYAGWEKDFEGLRQGGGESIGASGRPRGLMRTASYAPTYSSVAFKSDVVQSASTSSGFHQPPSFTGTSVGATAEPSLDTSSESNDSNAVFEMLHSLDYETDPLIDASGVNRVIRRGKMAVLTRDYSANGDSTPSRNSERRTSSASVRSDPAGPSIRSNFRRDTSLQARRASNFEEYEQTSASPWSQSPAPSPAIQSDPSTNPFFATTNVEEESFNPNSSVENYESCGPVNAIGVDNASTVVHLPLFHPMLSQSSQTIQVQPPTPQPPRNHATSASREAYNRSKVPEAPIEKKAPIAILSLYSSTVPYPQNLPQSLKMLGPHLAASLHIAHQFTELQKNAARTMHRRALSRRENPPATPGPGTSMHFDLDSILGSASVTSPSDYSARSRHSPGGSIVGTPGWDATDAPAPRQGGDNHEETSAADISEDYFDVKRRSMRAALGGQAYRHSMNEQGSFRPQSPTSITRPLLNRVDSHTKGEEVEASKSTHKSKVAIIKEAGKQRSQRSPPQQQDAFVVRRGSQHSSQQSKRSRQMSPLEPPGKHHSQLHSYGADFGASFPAAIATRRRGSSPQAQHSRSTSSNETTDVPPPSQSLYKAVVDSLPVQVFLVNATTGKTTWCNSRYEIYRGQTAAQAIRDPQSSVHSADREQYVKAWESSFRSGQQFAMKCRLLRFDGHYRWFFTRVAPLRDQRQRIVHWIGTNMDFHEQHIAEMEAARAAETAKSEAKYRALADSSPQIVFAVNRRGVTFCNTQWTLFSGQTEAEAAGLGFLKHVHVDDREKCKLPTFDDLGNDTGNVPVSIPPDYTRSVSYSDVQSASARSASEESGDSSLTVTSPPPLVSSAPVLMDLPQRKLSILASTGILRVTRDADGRPSYSTEVRLLPKDNGKHRWHLVRLVLAEPASAGEEEIWYGTCTDINDHKLLEQNLKETMDAKSRFLSNMSHEIRTPLNGIMGMADLLLTTTLTDEQMEQLTTIRQSTEALRGLINDILDLSKVEAGMINLSHDWFQVRSLVEEITDFNASLAAAKGLELNYIIDEDVPPIVKGDRFRIRQVLINLVGNAIKFTQIGEIFLRCTRVRDAFLTPSLSTNETLVRFEVIDTGSGFTEKEAEFLFERFSQIDGSSTRQHGGSGLGLVISLQLVELHGGKLSATSNPGKGSNFTFYVKFGVPTVDDLPSLTPLTLPVESASQSTPSLLPLPMARSASQTSPLWPTALFARQASRLESMSASEISESPEPYAFTPEQPYKSPTHSLLSSGSSDPSLRTAATSTRSQRSSASSYVTEQQSTFATEMNLALPAGASVSAMQDSSIGSRMSRPPLNSSSLRSESSLSTGEESPLLVPPMYSILVVSPLPYAREAVVRHIGMTIPQSIPSQITAVESTLECQRLIGGDDPVIFTHIVLVLRNLDEIEAFVDQVYISSYHPNAQVVVISDALGKKDLLERTGAQDYKGLVDERRLLFVMRPLKPSKFAAVFDPQRKRGMSTDPNQDTSQQIVVDQRKVFDDVTRRLGNQGKRVLLVEDNKVNQMVLLKFLKKTCIEVDSVLDGVQCTEKVFSKPPRYYSIILCDLHMPNKDGYQTCKDIRQWEAENKHPALAIVALSANVLGDVYDKCVQAGFNDYLTKPVDFKELAQVMINFMDPDIQGQPLGLMKAKPKTRTPTKPTRQIGNFGKR